MRRDRLPRGGAVGVWGRGGHCGWGDWFGGGRRVGRGRRRAAARQRPEAHGRASRKQELASGGVGHGGFTPEVIDRAARTRPARGFAARRYFSDLRYATRSARSCSVSSLSSPAGMIDVSLRVISSMAARGTR